MIKFENKMNGRFYYLKVERDLLNDWVLTIINGGHFSRRVSHFGFNNLDIINRHIERITKRRLKRGYEIVT